MLPTDCYGLLAHSPPHRHIMFAEAFLAEGLLGFLMISHAMVVGCRHKVWEQYRTHLTFDIFAPGARGMINYRLYSFVYVSSFVTPDVQTDPYFKKQSLFRLGLSVSITNQKRDAMQRSFSNTFRENAADPQGHPKGWSLGKKKTCCQWLHGWDGMAMPGLVTSAYLLFELPLRPAKAEG